MSGVVRLPYRRFLLYDLISATLVVSVVFGLSYLFGESVAAWVRHAEATATLIVLLVAAVIVGILYYRHREFLFQKLFGGNAPPSGG
jgi:membrane protein DedA with SNARE-associated domain